MTIIKRGLSNIKNTVIFRENRVNEVRNFYERNKMYKLFLLNKELLDKCKCKYGCTQICIKLAAIEYIKKAQSK